MHSFCFSVPKLYPKCLEFTNTNMQSIMKINNYICVYYILFIRNHSFVVMLFIYLLFSVEAWLNIFWCMGFHLKVYCTWSFENCTHVWVCKFNNFNFYLLRLKPFKDINLFGKKITNYWVVYYYNVEIIMKLYLCEFFSWHF